MLESNAILKTLDDHAYMVYRELPHRLTLDRCGEFAKAVATIEGVLLEYDEAALKHSTTSTKERPTVFV